MTSGQIATLAFLVLVIFIGVFLVKLMQLITRLSRSVRILTRDVDDINHQTNRVLASSNELLKEVNRKLRVINPVFQASAKLGRSVANVNDAVNQMVKRIRRHRHLKWLYRLASVVSGCFRFHNKD